MFELCLVSSRKKTSNLVEYDKVFQVPQRVEGLSACGAKVDSKVSRSQTPGETESPLRNRVIIEWLSSLPDVQSFLKSVTDFIDSKLLEVGIKDDSTDSNTGGLPIGEENDSKLSVCICCSTSGTSVSACCVELLYQVYSQQRHFTNFAVERHHEYATIWAKDMKKKCNLVWQCTLLPTKYYRSTEELQHDRMWGAIPGAIEDHIEEEFQKNPFNFDCLISNYQVNFEFGEIYSKHDSKTYRLRCVERDLDSRVECHMVDEPSYKKAARHFGAAGVLCYSAHPVTNEVIFLLGHINYSTRTWCDFGGLKSFREKPRQTAARECFEETLGVLGDAKELFEKLGKYKENHVFKIVNESCSYVSHFLYIRYDDYPDRFNKQLLENDCSVEVDDLKWFSLSSLREVLKKFLTGSEKLWAYPILPDGSVDKAIYYCMREEFVQTMCIAEKLDILHSMEHITGSVYQRKRSGKAQHMQPQAATASEQRELKGECDGAENISQQSMHVKEEAPKYGLDCHMPGSGREGSQTSHDTREDAQSTMGEELSTSTREIQDSDHLAGSKNSDHQAGSRSEAFFSGTPCHQKNCSYKTYGMGAGKILPLSIDPTHQSKSFYYKSLQTL